MSFALVSFFEEATEHRSRSFRRRLRRRRVIERLAVASQLQALNALAGPPSPAPEPALQGMDLSDDETTSACQHVT